MSLRRLFNVIRALPINKNLRCNVISMQQRCLSAKIPSTKPNEFGDVKKPKRPFVPKVTLLSEDTITVTTLEEAQKLSKRRDLKLVKLVDLDTKTQRSVYKLMTGSEYHAEDLKQREERKKERLNSNAIKGEKVLVLNAGIGTNDLKVHVNKITKWIDKKYEARVVINGTAASMEKAESVYKFLEDNLKDHGRFLQKRIKGSDIKFNINPPKNDKEDVS